MRMMALVGSFVVASAANAVALYDTLENQYDNGWGNCLGGRLVLGTVYDLEVADDITLTAPTTITTVSVRNLTFGVASANQAYLRIFRDSGGHPGTEITGPEGDLVPIDETEFTDLVFDLVGKDVHATGLNYSLSPGTYWIGLQVISDDWHWTASGQHDKGGNGHWRQGLRAPNDNDPYWHDDYRSDFNMRVEGDVVPEPMTMLAVGGGLMALIARRRRNSSSLTDYNWRKRNE